MFVKIIKKIIPLNFEDFQDIPILKYLYYLHFGRKFLNDPIYKNQQYLTKIERSKQISRTDIINFIISKNKNSSYLEIGVRKRESNFNHIKAKYKYSVDPFVKLENKKNHFQIESDDFFKSLNKGNLLKSGIKFDLIFIDGLHLAEQVERDIKNSLKYIKDDGFIVLHDCNPISEWHARQTYRYDFTPAKKIWNGTVWKAFMKKRFDKNLFTCCIDTDMGVGIISKTKNIGKSINKTNTFYEFEILRKNRKKLLNLIDFEEFKNLF